MHKDRHRDASSSINSDRSGVASSAAEEGGFGSHTLPLAWPLLLPDEFFADYKKQFVSFMRSGGGRKHEVVSGCAYIAIAVAIALDQSAKVYCKTPKHTHIGVRRLVALVA